MPCPGDSAGKNAGLSEQLCTDPAGKVTYLVPLTEIRPLLAGSSSLAQRRDRQSPRAVSQREAAVSQVRKLNELAGG